MIYVSDPKSLMQSIVYDRLSSAFQPIHFTRNTGLGTKVRLVRYFYARTVHIMLEDDLSNLFKRDNPDVKY